jgi:hypothetical protein
VAASPELADQLAVESVHPRLDALAAELRADPLVAAWTSLVAGGGRAGLALVVSPLVADQVVRALLVVLHAAAISRDPQPDS